MPYLCEILEHDSGLQRSVDICDRCMGEIRQRGTCGFDILHEQRESTFIEGTECYICGEVADE